MGKSKAEKQAANRRLDEARDRLERHAESMTPDPRRGHDDEFVRLNDDVVDALKDVSWARRHCW